MHAKDDELVAALAPGLEGEELLAAAYVKVHTSLSATRYLTPLGNYLIARPAARSAAKKITAETEFPLDAAMVFGITPNALHVWRADPMLNQVTDQLGHIPLDRITAFAVKPGHSWQPVTITLEDGHSFDLEGRGAVYQIESEFRKIKGS
jgi:hypothetical protein